MGYVMKKVNKVNKK